MEFNRAIIFEVVKTTIQESRVSTLTQGRESGLGSYLKYDLDFNKILEESMVQERSFVKR